MPSTSDTDLISDALTIIDNCRDSESSEFSKEKNSKGKQNEKRGKTKLNISGNPLAAELAWTNTSAHEEKSRHAAKISANDINSDERDHTVHVKTFDKIMKYIHLCAKPFGIEISYFWIPKKHKMWWFTVFLTVFTWFSIFYTQVIHLSNGDTLRVLEACAIYGIASSCTQKILGYLNKRKDLVTLLKHIRKICLQNEAGSRADIIKARLHKTFTFLMVFFVGVMSSIAVFVFFPIKTYIVEGQLMSLLPLEIIFVDLSTYSGYVIGNIAMILMGLFAALGSALYGAAFIFCVLNYTLQAELIGQDFQDLDEMWTNKTLPPVLYKRAYLSNICIKRQDLKRYMDVIKKIFERKFFFYFCFNYFSQIICLFEITKNDWSPGYAIAQGLFTEMMFYCIMGTQTTIADDKLCIIIYNSKWYEYDLHSQRMVQLLLHRCQNSDQIQLGFLGPLNVVTGIEIVKSIYTYYTVLTEVL